jgi:hypothetical protein
LNESHQLNFLREDTQMNRSKLTAVAAIIFLVALSVLAQSTSIKVDGNIIKSYIATMADAAHQGRRSLTPGYEKTAEWAAGLFKQWGLKPAGENGTYFQNVPILTDPAAPQPPRTFVWRLGVPELTISGRSFLLRDNEFSLDDSSTALAKVSGDIVFVGYGISAPDKGLDEYSADVKGKIVLAFKGSPKDAPALGGRMGASPAPATTTPAEAWEKESQDAFKAKVAYDKGAAAILLYNPPATPAAGARGGAAAPAATPPGGRGAAPAVEPSPFKRPFIVVSNIDERVFRWIMWRNPQQAANEFNAGIDQMRRDIRDKKVRTMSTGLKGTVKGFDSVTLYGERFKNNTSRNVLGKIEGTDPNLKNQYVIVGGHMDHNGVVNGVVLNGADDNASGTAVAMEVGRLLVANKVQPKRTVIVGLWCGEEEGLIGSRYYVTHPTDGVSMDRVVTYFNMDMVGLGDRIGAPGALNFPEIFNIIMRNQDPQVSKAVDASTGGPGGSDHSGFIELGIEALALMTSGGGGHPDYHQSGDDTEKIEPAILATTGQFVLQGVLNLANETQANLLIPDRLHIYNAQALSVTDMRGGPPPAGRGGDTQQGGRGRGGLAFWPYVQASNNGELAKLADDRIKQLIAAAQAQAGAAAGAAGGRGGGRGGGGARYSLGVRDSGVFDGSIPVLVQSASLLNFGRVDVASNDGSWFNFNSGVSAQGREAVKAMEANNISLNLIDPSAKLLGDTLDVTTKPFLVTVTGTAPIDQAMVTRMNQKNTLLLFECDPADAAGCANRLQSYKKQFGDSDNLVMSVKRAPSESIDAFKKTLYLTLIKSSWTKEEIYAVCGVTVAPSGGRGGAAGGNLSKLSPPTGGGRGGN